MTPPAAASINAQTSPARSQTNRRRKSSLRKSPILSSVAVGTGSGVGGVTGAEVRAMTGASCCSLALLARRALAIRSSALIPESAAGGGVVPEAADMALTLVIRYADQHYRKFVDVSFSKLAYFAESRTASVERGRRLYGRR
ncbi:conserved hypothetical protein [Mesorhizobium prunaredense]|uniref:Uncharacterized protein n=1 Tax=Mesorhizobium prunaredense TaxID=1631249 RepID=A0A1R3V1J4_9HYPH|nr:conserved hypothetical protein [Mesorhizobium prunaredense]